MLTPEDAVREMMCAAIIAAPILNGLTAISLANADGEEFACYTLRERRWKARRLERAAVGLPLLYVTFKSDAQAVTVVVELGDVRIN
jgi:hypothetical protein